MGGHGAAQEGGTGRVDRTERPGRKEIGLSYKIHANLLPVVVIVVLQCCRRRVVKRKPFAKGHCWGNGKCRTVFSLKV